MRLPFDNRLARSYSFAALALVCSPAFAGPFPTRDQNPLLAGYGLPMPMQSRLPSADTWQWNADFNWASTALLQNSSRESLMVDAETRELRLALGRSFGERWSLQLQVPYRYTGGGSLDSFIDSWHDFFNLPEGIRPELPHDQFRIAYERDDALVVDARSSGEGIGDITAAMGYQWIASTDTSLAGWLLLDLPTGDADKFTGNGATDVSIALAGEHQFANRWSVFAQAAVTYLGQGDRFGDEQQNLVWSGLVGGGVDVWRGLELKAQIDAHSATLKNTELDYLGDALILTVGGAWQFQSGVTLNLGVSEDIAVETSPDVVFVIGLSYGQRSETNAHR
ncbi:MAG: DUF3187 family protein [Povalibacter sp.]